MGQRVTEGGRWITASQGVVVVAQSRFRMVALKRFGKQGFWELLCCNAQYFVPFLTPMQICLAGVSVIQYCPVQ